MIIWSLRRPTLASWTKKFCLHSDILGCETIMDAGPKEFFFWNAAKAAVLASVIVILEALITERSLDTTPKDTLLTLQVDTSTLLPSPTEIALSIIFLKLLFRTSALLPLKSTPSPPISLNWQFRISPITKSPSNASDIISWNLQFSRVNSV